MATSRTQVAEYLASNLDNPNRSEVIKSVAAWLDNNGKNRQATYLISDVVKTLYDKGYIFATITTARPATQETKDNVISYLKGLGNVVNVECQWKTDNSLIGGLVIETAGGNLDASIKGRLAKLVEGVIV